MIGTILPWLVALLSGNLVIPHNDAWSHSKIGQIFGQTGEFQLQSWNGSALVGQIVILGPYASSIFIQQTFVTLMTVLSLLAVRSILKESLNNGLSGFAIFLISKIKNNM